MGGLGIGIHAGRLNQHPSAAAAFSRYPALSTAYSAGMGRIGIIGDSRNSGHVAGTAGSNTNGHNLSPAKTLQSDLTAAGYLALDGYFTSGNQSAITPAELALYDSRIAFSDVTGWSIDGGQIGLDSFILKNDSTANTLTLTPAFAYDRIEAVYLSAGQGTFTIKQGATTVRTVDQSAAAGINTTGAISVTRSSTALTITRATTTAWVMPFIRVWDSTTRHIQIQQMGAAGRTTAAWLAATNPWNPYPALALAGCHLYIVELGVNDFAASVTAATFKINLQTLITYLKSLGADVLLVLTGPANPAGAYNIDAAYKTAIADLTTSNGLAPYVDLQAVFTSYAASTAFYVDDVHFTAAGNVLSGHAMSAKILA